MDEHERMEEPQGAAERPGTDGPQGDDGAGEGIGGVGAIFGPTISAIVAPARCWKSLEKRPVVAVWILVWVAAISLVLGHVNRPITQRAMSVAAEGQMADQGDAPPEQVERMREGMEWWAGIVVWATPVFVAVAVLFWAALIWGGSAMLGGSARFAHAFAVSAAAAVVTPLLFSLYATLILQLNPPEIRRAEDVFTLQPSSGLDLFVGRLDLPTWMEVSLAQVSLFNIWWIALVASGGMALLGLTKGKAVALGIGGWLLGALWNVVTTAMRMPAG